MKALSLNKLAKLRTEKVRSWWQRTVGALPAQFALQAPGVQLKRMTYLLLLQFLTFGLFAQFAPGLSWKKVIGGKKGEIAYDIISTFNGDIALVGETTSPPASKKDARWVLLDAAGNLKKEVLLGGENEDVLTSIVQTYDGGYAMAGYTNSFGQGKTDGWLVKLDEKGDTAWQKAVGYHREESFTDLVQTVDGGLLAVGSIEAPTGQGRKNMWVYKTYEDGSLRWQRSFGEREFDEARAVVEADNGNIAIAGVTSSGKGTLNIWLFILDKDGVPLYHRIFGNRQRDEVHDLVHTIDGGYALVGYTKSTSSNDGGGLKDAWVIKTDANGEMLWEKTFGGKNNDSALGITETADANLVIVGYTFSHLIGANTSGAFLVKMDENGNKIWEQEQDLGGKGNDVLNAVSLLPNGCLIAAGATDSKQENAQGEDMWVMRLNCDFDINTTISTQLVISDIHFKDNGDQFLEEEEEAFIEFILENRGQEPVFEIDLVVKEQNAAKGLRFRNLEKIGFLAGGKSKLIRLPVWGLEGITIGEAAFEIFASDASRSRTDVVELKIETKPLNIPSNYLDINWMNPSPVEHPDSKIVVKYPQVGIRLRARSDKQLNRSNFTIFLNGQPYKVGQKAGEAGLRSKGQANKVYIYEYTNQLDLLVGLNNVVVEVENGSKKIQSTAFQIFYSDKPNLHIISIGIDHDDLEYTKKDALDFAKSFENQEGKLFDRFFTTLLVSGQRTKAGLLQTNGDIIKKAFLDLRDNYSYTIYKRDVLIVFLSSHGKAIGGDFKVVPSDFALVGESALIDYKKDIIEQLEAIDCHKMIFIDACQSGSSANQPDGGSPNGEGVERAGTLVNLSANYQNTGTLASCEASESSWEDASWGNGAFTKAIIGAFKNESYEDSQGRFTVSSDDNIITLGELYQYIHRRVPQMIRDANKSGTQHPFISSEQISKVKDLAVFTLE